HGLELGAGIEHAVSIAIDARQAPGETPLDAAARRIGEREMLLVLDTCEHVRESAAAAADLLLQRCPSLHVVATSREPLAIAEEAVWPVPPLGDAEDAGELGDAGTLFCVRAALEPE